MVAEQKYDRPVVGRVIARPLMVPFESLVGETGVVARAADDPKLRSSSRVGKDNEGLQRRTVVVPGLVGFRTTSTG
jgi:hypothetical protein